MKVLLTTIGLALAVASVQPVWAENYPADNTGKNVRDRDGGTMTSGDQSNSSADVRITQEIRQALVADDSLSTNAKNVKVITASGIVTLRGPVDSTEEKAKVYAAAQKVPGVSRINNEIEVVRQ